MSEKIESRPESTEAEAPKVETAETARELTDEQAAAIAGGINSATRITTPPSSGKPTKVVVF